MKMEKRGKNNMIKKVALFLLLALWITGQYFIAVKHLYEGLFISVAAIGIGSVIILVKRSYDNYVPYAALLGIIAAFTASSVVRHNPQVGLLLFVLSGLLIFIAKPEGEKLTVLGDVPEKSYPMEKWEPYFLTILLIFSGIIRFYDLLNLHQGVYGHDSILFSNVETLMASPLYIPHIGGGSDWPTLVYYQAAFFGKLFGWNIGSMRMESACWGLLDIAALYFLIRMLASPWAAAIMTALFAVSVPHLNFSRTFFPGTVVMLAPILGFSLLLTAVKLDKWNWFMFAGFAAGLSLHGYVPGRIVFLMFLLWFIWIWLFYRKKFPKIKNVIIFWIAFIAIASPVIWFAITNPEQYNGYVNSVNPNKSAGIMGYITMFINQIGSYAGMFHVKGAWDTLFHEPFEPILDWFTGALFPMGLFMCLLMFWKPIPVFIFIYFIGGMAPAMLGGGCSPQPDVRRMLLALPVIYIFGGIAFERLRLVARNNFGGKGSGVSFWVFVFTFLLALPFGANEINTFLRQQKDPITLAITEHYSFLAGKEIQKYAGDEIKLMNLYDLTNNSCVLLPRNVKYTVVKWIDDMMVLNPAKDNVLLLEPVYESMIPMLKRMFPDCDVKIFREERTERITRFDNNPAVTETMKYTDPYNKFVYLVRVFIPKEDSEKFTNELFVAGPGGQERKSVYLPEFASVYSGRQVTISGGLILKQEGDLVKFKMDWGGFTLLIDGKQANFGSQRQLEGGTHYFVLRGTVPRGAKTGLPLSILRGEIDLKAEGRVVAIAPSAGVVITFSQGKQLLANAPDSITRRSIAPIRRFYHTMDYYMPFPVTVKGYISFPEKGEYEFMAPGYIYNRILIDGKVVFDNYEYGTVKNKASIWLEKNRKVTFVVENMVNQSDDRLRGIIVYYREKGRVPWNILSPDFIDQLK
jgi:4-amino-4-deoxy-L-arabinose transferase-like glycosyltransferase